MGGTISAFGELVGWLGKSGPVRLASITLKIRCSLLEMKKREMSRKMATTRILVLNNAMTALLPALCYVPLGSRTVAIGKD